MGSPGRAAWPEVSEYKWGNRAFTHGAAGVRVSPIRVSRAAMQTGALSMRNQSPSWTVRGPAWERVSRPKTE